MCIHFLDPIVVEPDNVTIQNVHQPKPHKLFVVLYVLMNLKDRAKVHCSPLTTLFSGATTHMLGSDVPKSRVLPQAFQAAGSSGGESGARRRRAILRLLVELLAVGVYSGAGVLLTLVKELVS